MKVFAITLGCKVNQYETQVMLANMQEDVYKRQPLRIFRIHQRCENALCGNLFVDHSFHTQKRRIYAVNPQAAYDKIYASVEIRLETCLLYTSRCV